MATNLERPGERSVLPAYVGLRDAKWVTLMIKPSYKTSEIL